MRLFRLNGFKVNIVTEPRVKPMSKFGVANTFKAIIEAEVTIDNERKGSLRLMWKRAPGTCIFKYVDLFLELLKVNLNFKGNADTKGIVWDAALYPF